MYARIQVLKFLLANHVPVTDDHIFKADFAVRNGPLPANPSTGYGDPDRISEAKAVLESLKIYQAKQKRSLSRATTNNTTNEPILNQFSSQSLLQSLTLDPILEESYDDNDEKENEANLAPKKSA